MLDLEVIKARYEAATPAPWSCESDWPQVYTLAPGLRGKVVARGYAGQQALSKRCDPTPDTIFIAHAREDVPALVAEVERLRAGLRDVAQFAAASPPDWTRAHASALLGEQL